MNWSDLWYEIRYSDWGAIFRAVVGWCFILTVCFLVYNAGGASWLT